MHRHPPAMRGIAVGGNCTFLRPAVPGFAQTPLEIVSDANAPISDMGRIGG
jgi:hypothetical protein